MVRKFMITMKYYTKQSVQNHKVKCSKCKKNKFMLQNFDPLLLKVHKLCALHIMRY